jgi:predicted Rdx family selenoprotein
VTGFSTDLVGLRAEYKGRPCWIRAAWVASEMLLVAAVDEELGYVTVVPVTHGEFRILSLAGPV